MKLSTVTFRIVLERPPAGVDFAMQEGRGSSGQVVQTQKSTGANLNFEFTANVKPDKDGQPNFTGSFVQGPVGDRFVYINIGTYAGQADSIWSRRLKIPLSGISWEMLRSQKVLRANVPGTGKDGGPSCAYSWRKAVGPSWSWQVD